MIKEKQAQIRTFQTWLKKTDFITTFWHSAAYLALSQNVVWYSDEMWNGWKEADTGHWFLPPRARTFYNNKQMAEIGLSIRIGWPQTSPPDENMKLFDHQYYYRSDAFTEDLLGSRWSVFRKNVRKYSARTKGELTYREIRTNELDDAGSLVLQWGKGRTIYDPETFVGFVVCDDLPDVYRKGLWCDNKLVGVNVWDKALDGTWIYRICIDNGSPFLQEYLRHQFYLDMTRTHGACWINDGGDLGNKGLAAFKRKLRPHSVLSIPTINIDEPTETI